MLGQQTQSRAPWFQLCFGDLRFASASWAAEAVLLEHAAMQGFAQGPLALVQVGDAGGVHG